MERASGQPAHTFRVANAGAVAAGGDVVTQRPLVVIQAPREVQRAPTGLRSEVIEIQPRIIKDKITFNSAESRGEVGFTGGGVINVNAAIDAWAIQRAFERDR